MKKDVLRKCKDKLKKYKLLKRIYGFYCWKRKLYEFKLCGKRINRRFRMKDKISIIFLLQMPEHWNSLKTVYAAALDNNDIKVQVLLLPIKNEAGIWEYKDDKVYKEIYPEYTKVFDEVSGEWIDWMRFSPDYVFFERPYNELIPQGYVSHEVMKYAKVCYIPYGYILTDSKEVFKVVIGERFFVDCSLFFAPWEAPGKYCEELFYKYGRKNRKVVYLGYPRFDLLPDYIEDDEKNKYTIMWTPRWTLRNVDIDDESSNTSFFDYKDSIIKRSECEKDEYWIVRPHPYAFRHYIERGIMTADEVNRYVESLNGMENACLDKDSDYLQGFKKADILVTDFSSLIIEFFVMGKPIIYCGSIDALPIKELRDNVYKVDCWCEVEAIIDNLKKGIDPLKESRLSAARKLKVADAGSIGANIVDYIVSDFKGIN